jgi:hypothetical protein
MQGGLLLYYLYALRTELKEGSNLISAMFASKKLLQAKPQD